MPSSCLSLVLGVWALRPFPTSLSSEAGTFVSSWGRGGESKVGLLVDSGHGAPRKISHPQSSPETGGDGRRRSPDSEHLPFASAWR